MSDRVAVFDDVFALFHILDEHFVSGRSVLIDDNLLVVDFDDVAFLFGFETYYNRVGWIDFEISLEWFHFV